MGSRPYRWLNHTADIRVRVTGRTLRDLFCHAALALTDALTDPKKVKGVERRRLRRQAPDREGLLVVLLRELLFLFETRAFLTRRVVIERLGDTMLVGWAVGERMDPSRHRLKTELKAVTYHGLSIRRGRGRWVTEIIFDV